MTALEHSPLNRADEGGVRDQSGVEPRTQVRETGVRAALIEVLRDAIPPRMTEGYYARVADRILALVRPVEGVVLTTEEKATILDALLDIPDMDERMARIRPSRQREIDERRALAARLETTP